MSKLHHNAKDLTKQKIGRLIVVESTDERCNGHIVWRCLCDCGNECFVMSSNLIRKHTKSCGCLSKELTKKRSTKHGMRKAPIYYIWCSMLARCENPNNPAYKNYGGRGIKVCERWHKFENFYADVGNPPKDMTLDRWPDNDGDYEPTNWRWATRSQQRFNSRPASCGPFKQRWFFAYNGNTGEWLEDNNQRAFARRLNLDKGHISACLHDKQQTHKGWTFQWLPNKENLANSYHR